ncbi:MAG TPA: hypothetical protein VLW45_13855 [Pelomicrobium sp.]|nr:hypothetical protein [Pelomicrobium sp.]
MTPIRSIVLLLALLPAAGAALAAPETDGHRLMAEAHGEAASCLRSGAAIGECVAALEARCGGVAAGPACGARADRNDDAARRADRHARMSAAHAAAAACLAAGKPTETCEKQLRADCRGLSVNSHCGMKDHHH